MPKPRLLLNPTREGNHQYLDIEQTDGKVRLEYLMIQPVSAGNSYLGEVPVFTKKIVMVYDPSNIRKGIGISNIIEMDSRALSRFDEGINPEYFREFGRGIKERVNSIMVNGKTRDNYSNTPDHTLYTLEDTVFSMQQIPGNLMDPSLLSELEKARFFKIVDHLSAKLDKVITIKRPYASKIEPVLEYAA